MTIWTRTRPSYERKDRINLNVSYDARVCDKCGALVVFDIEGAICKVHGRTSFLSVPEGQYTEFVQTIKECGALFSALTNAVENVYAGDGHVIDAAMKLEKMDADWEAHCKEVNDTRVTDYPM